MKSDGLHCGFKLSSAWYWFNGSDIINIVNERDTIPIQDILLARYKLNRKILICTY